MISSSGGSSPLNPNAIFKLREIVAESLHFPNVVAVPDITIIIPIYGQLKHTLNCLSSILEHLPKATIEVIVAEDASGDPEIAKLRFIRNLKFIENPQNLGFLKSCNSAAKMARGRYIYLLNNDTIVTPGAIDALFELAESRQDAGLVGSRLIYPDGRQQEAGGIVWDDASAWNYGRLDDSSKPQYQHVREVDYISGASILVPRLVWNELGGFDEYFLPAYYEDADLAFRIRAIGKKVYFQPRSVVCHFEGVSHGTDLQVGVKAHQVSNQVKMAERWKEKLQKENFPSGQNFFRARERAKNKPVILVVDHYVPEPDKDAGSRNIVEFMRSLLLQGWIVKFWPQSKFNHPVYTPPLQQMGIEVLYGPHVTSMKLWLEENGNEIDYAMIVRPHVAEEYLDDIRRLTNAAILYYGCDLHFSRMRMEASVKNDKAIAVAADEMEKQERDIWLKSDAVLYPSLEEVEAVRVLAPTVEASSAPIFCFDSFAHRNDAPMGKNIIFVAGFIHPPNVDAAIWFVREILPLIRLHEPDVTLSLVGSNPTAEVVELAADRIEVTGWVSAAELATRYAAARVAVVPLRFGAGVKLKVVEALVEGVPLVTTLVGAQGLSGLQSISEIKTEAHEFAESVLKLLKLDDLSWLARSKEQVEFASANFGREHQTEMLLKALGNASRVHEERNRNSRTNRTGRAGSIPGSSIG